MLGSLHHAGDSTLRARRGPLVVVDGLCEVLVEIVFKGRILMMKVSDPLPNV